MKKVYTSQNHKVQANYTAAMSMVADARKKLIDGQTRWHTSNISVWSEKKALLANFNEMLTIAKTLRVNAML